MDDGRTGCGEVEEEMVAGDDSSEGTEQRTTVVLPCCLPSWGVLLYPWRASACEAVSIGVTRTGR